jgi:hypothetical protein
MKTFKTLLKAAGVPVGIWALATTGMLVRNFVPALQLGLFADEDPVWVGLMILGYGGLIAGTPGAWMWLRRRLQTSTALMLLVPYLALVALGVVVTAMATMAITGDSF